jgi:hypothetical protein
VALHALDMSTTAVSRSMCGPRHGLPLVCEQGFTLVGIGQTFMALYITSGGDGGAGGGPGGCGLVSLM